MPTPHRITFLMLSSLLALVVSAAPRAAADQPSPPAAQSTPLLVTTTNAPLRVLGSDGVEHVFDRYTLVGTVDAVESETGLSPALHVGGTPRAQTSTYPLVLTVQDFR